MPKRSGSTLDDLVVQAKITNRLLVAGLKANMKQQEIIALLETTGATQQEIADVLDTSADVVSVTLRRLKKKKETAKAKPAASES